MAQDYTMNRYRKEERNEELACIRDYLQNTVDAVNEMLDGYSEIGVCRKYGIKQMGFRHMVTTLYGRKNKEITPIEEPVYNFKSEDELWFSPAEKIWVAAFSTESRKACHMPIDISETMEFILKDMDNERDSRYRESLILYFYECLSLQEISEIFGVSRQRVREIVIKSLRIIRRRYQDLMLKGITVKNNFDKERIENDILRLNTERSMYLKMAEQKEAYEEMLAACKSIADAHNLEGQPVDPKIATLNYILANEPMSKRSYNCLKRHTILNKGSGEISIDEITPDYLMCIRNFGRRCYREVNQIFSKYHWKYSDVVEV